MNFLAKIKNITISAKCLSGWHSGSYLRMKNKPQCHLEKTCPDCGKYIAKKDHAFTRWKHVNELTCNAERECIHCNHIETKMMHGYERVGKNPVNCKVIRHCVRCNDKQIGQAEHNWFQRSVEERQSGVKKVCKDCGKVES